MKICIDTDKIEETGLNIAETMYLVSLYFKQKIELSTFKSLCNKGLIQYDFISRGYAENVKINQYGINTVEALVLNSEIQQLVPVENTTKDRFEVLADKLRDLYPSGRKPGTAYQWRDSTKVIALRLKTLVRKFDADFTDEQAINATRKYVNSFNGNYKRMRLLKYFVLKSEKDADDNINIISELMSLIENEGQINEQREDWEATLV